MASYTRLKNDYELKYGKVGQDIEIMYNSIDNSIAYDYGKDKYIINNQVVDNGNMAYELIYEILSYELDLLGFEHFNKLINQYGDFVEYWLNELNQ